MTAALLAGPGSGPKGDYRPARGRIVAGYVVHVTGGAVGGLALGVLLAGVASLASVHYAIRFGVALAMTTVALVLSLPRFAPLAGVGSHWQVPQGRRLRQRHIGRHATLFLWGALLGVGVLTVVPHAVSLLLPAVTVAVGSPAAAVLAGSTYGFARALLAVASSAAFLRRDATPGDVIDRYEGLIRRWSAARVAVAPFAAPTVVAVVVTDPVVRSWT